MKRRDLVCAAAGTLALAGCGGGTVPRQPEAGASPAAPAADAARGKTFVPYTEALLVLPPGDPRRMGPATEAALQGLGFKVLKPDPRRPLLPSQGTGFVVGADGRVLTCAHVLGGAREAMVTLGGHKLRAELLHADRAADLALLKLREPLPAGATVLALRAADAGYRMGEDVYTIGYPLSALLGNSARMSRGLLSATAGLRDDPKQLQVSAEVHPGNSGGPLLDREGRVIGVVQKVINPWAVATATGGALPQNINFAIKSSAVVDFLRAANAWPLPDAEALQQQALEGADRAVAKIESVDDAERRGKLLVVLQYPAGERAGEPIRQLALTAIDLQTMRPLYATRFQQAEPRPADDVLQGALQRLKQAVTTR